MTKEEAFEKYWTEEGSAFHSGKEFDRAAFYAGYEAANALEPIETAPLLRKVIMAEGDNVFIGHVSTSGSCYSSPGMHCVTPTHWRPLPTPPSLST